MPSIEQLLGHAQQQLAAVVDAPLLEAQLLLAEVLQVERSYFYCHQQQPVAKRAQAEFAALLKRRLAAEPMAYIRGRQEFWQHSFAVSPATLIPRPETELLLELALDFTALTSAVQVLELGTGSGCIAISIGLERPNWQVLAVDISSASLRIARSNAAQLQAKNVAFLQSDWFAELEKSQMFDIIVSNPPYIAADDPHLAKLTMEPRQALVAADAGLGALKHIIANSYARLNPGGQLLLEFGHQQAGQVEQLLAAAKFRHIGLHRDLAGIVRAASAKR